MRRLVPFLLAAIMAAFPPTILLILIGGPASTSGPTLSVHPGDAAGFVPHHPVGVAALPSAYAHSHSPHAVMAAATSVASSAGYVAASPAESSAGGGSGGKPKSLRPGRPLQPMEQEALARAAAAGDGGEAAPPDTLKVSVLGASRGRSPDCTYSLVEFSNTHHSDTIVVHSTYIEPTVVFPPNWTSTDPLQSLPDEPPPPPQYHKEVYEGRHLKVPPRSRMTIPVSIIPSYRKPPDLGREYRSSVGGSGGSRGSAADHLSLLSALDATNITETAILSPASHADILDMLANYRRDSNRSATNIHNRSRLLSEGTVHETLVAYTNWGFVQMRVPYVCSPSHVESPSEYEYGLPNSLMFLDGGGGWYARRNTTPTVELAYLFGDWDFNPTRDEMDPFVYRVYMNNPTEGELRIWDVHTTKPDVVGVEMQLHFDTSTTSSFRRMNDVEHYYPFRGQSNPPKKNNVYVATVRLLPDRFTLDMMSTSTHLDLGFLVVRTNVGTFSIALDFIPNGGRGGVIHGVEENSTTLDDVHLVRDHVMNGLLSEEEGSADQNPPNITIVKSFQQANHAPPPSYAKDEEKVVLKYIDAPLLNAHPASIHFGSITTGSRVVRIPVQLGNLHDRPLRIMRISVAMSTVSDDGGNATDISDERNGMEIGVDFSNGGPMTSLGSDCAGGVDSISTKKEEFAFPRDFVLPASVSADVSLDPSHTIHVWCRFNASPSRGVNDVNTTVLPRFYTGSLIVHATEDLYVPYKEWEEQLLLQHYLGGHPPSSLPPYQLQIPFEGSVLPGNLGAPTDSLLYPRAFYVLPAEERVKIMAQHGSSSTTPEYFDRELDLTNNFAVPISITGMKILEAPNMDDYCTSRFTPSMVLKEGAEHSTADTGEKWKGLSVRYHFRNEDYLGGIPTLKCILSIETDKAGKQSLPLIVYSGEMLVDVERPDGGQLTVHCVVRHDAKGHNHAPGHVVSRSGMPCMKDWMKSTPEGRVLGHAIGDYFLDKLERSKKASRGRQCPYTVGMDPFSLYFQSLLSGAKSSVVLDEEALHQDLHPIAMSFGAIATGESTSRSILFTNLNQVPIQVSATTAGLGNMNVTIGILPSIIRGMFNEKEHPPERADQAYFLRHSSVAKDLFAKFKHTFDIGISPRFQNVPLHHEYVSLFQRHAESHHFSNATEYLAGYVAEEESRMNSQCACGYIISTDSTYDREICTRKAGKKYWTIPPGGVARFVVTIRAPSQSELKNDVTSFVGTGLVLETNHGQAFPLVLTYSTIAGQVSISSGASGGHSTSLVEDIDRANHVPLTFKDPTIGTSVVYANHVPLTFKDPTIGPSVDAFAQRHGVPLEIESSFSRSIFLSEVRSCNKWFNVFLPADNPGAREFFSSKGRHFLQIDSTKATDGDQSKAALPLGKILSALSCNHPSGDTSFWACALAWLENRADIQAPGCGLSENELVERKDEVHHPFDDPASTKTVAIGALRDVVAFLSVRYASDNATEAGAASAEPKPAGGYVHYSRMLMFDHVREAWKAIANLKLNVLTGHIDAKTLYFSENRTMKEMIWLANEAANSRNVTQMQQLGDILPLTIPVASLLLKSSLDIPKLFYDPDDQIDGNAPTVSQADYGMGAIDFETIHVADVSTRMVPIVNPTATAIRVKLAAIQESEDGSFASSQYSNKSVFVQDMPVDRNSWWTGGSYWMSSSDSDGDGGHLMSASHNVTIKSGAGAYVSLLNPALHAMNAFILGCGKRCGLRNEAQDQHGNSAFGGEEKNYSPIGAGSGSDSVLFGRNYECDKASGLCPSSTAAKGDWKKSPQKVMSMTDPPAFSLGRVANEIVIPPYGVAELGPVYFRPPGRGLYESSVYIENSLTGFEEVKVSGRGGWEKLVFLDQLPSDGSNDDEGGDVEFRFGQSALVFPGSNSVGNGGNSGPALKSVRLVNQGDVPVDISRVYMASSEVMHFTHKRRHPSESRHDAYGKLHRTKCSARGFVLPGCVEPHASIWIEALFDWYNSIRDFIAKKLPLPNHKEGKARKASELIAERFYTQGFTLRPNETQSIYIAHYPDCTFQTSYASVIFEIGNRSQQANPSRGRVGSWQQTFRQQKMELLVGYDMSASEYRTCTPYSPPETTIWERKLQIQVPSLIQDLMSFGLTRWTDANGKPYVHRIPIEVTILAASFALLLVVLSLDLLFTVEISTNRKSCPSWKPTCRCLARADPASSDLASIGKEQTKHVLLSRFKKEGVLPSHCILSDGSFSREKKLGGGAGGTHSEAIFERLNLVGESKMTEEDDEDSGGAAGGLLPCGLGWRTALRRGVGLPSSTKNDGGVSPEFQYLTRTRDQYLKKQKEQKQQLARAPMSTPTKARNVAVANGRPNVAKPVTEPAAAPLPQDRTIGEPQIRKVQTANGRNALSSDEPVVPKASTHAATASKASAKGASKVNPPVVDRSAGKLKQQQQQKDKKVADTKAKKTRSEPKDAKTERANVRTETKKDAKQEGAKTIASQKQARLAKLSEKPSQEHGTDVSTKESASAQAKQQSKQTKKQANGAKVTEQQQTKSGKQGAKVKGTTKKQATTTKTPKSPSAQRQRTRSSNDAEFPPLAVPQTPTQKKMSKQQQQAPAQQSKGGNVSRPPPGLLAPPGFLDQTDPSSPVPSPTRLSASATHMSPSVQPLTSSGVSGADIIPSPTPQMNNDLLSLLGVENESGSTTPHPLESSLFQAQLDSPRADSEGSGLLVPQLLPQSFIPPTESEQKQGANPDVRVLLGAGSNFNVSNFLDGILSDAAPPPLPAMNEEPAQAKAAEVTEPIAFGATGLGVSLDPWNSSDTSSARNDSNRSSSTTNPLAALRGTSESSHTDSFIAGIPLSGDAPSLFATATAATLHGRSNSGTAAAVPVFASVVSEGEDEGDELLEPDSFYSNLLGE